MRHTQEILNGTWAGTHFNSTAAAARACLLDVLTAHGLFDYAGALEIAVEDGKTVVIEEIKEQFDYEPAQVEALVDAWQEVIDTLSA